MVGGYNIMDFYSGLLIGGIIGMFLMIMILGGLHKDE